MRKRQFKTQADLDRHIAKGYGTGEGDNYIPWLRVQDISSHGRSRKVQGTKVNRIHHVFSDLEYSYLLLLEFSEQVVDIREQFPLFPTAYALETAARLGISYPRYPSTSVPFVMTTDFLVTLQGLDGTRKLAARTLKYEDELGDPSGLQRRLEKFEIEKAIWENQGVTDWKIVTNNSIGKTLSSNLQWLRKGAKPERHLMNEDVHRNFLDQLAYFASKDRTLSSVIRAAGNGLRLPYSDAVLLFKHLAWEKFIIINLANDELQLTGACPALSIATLQLNKRAA